MERWEVERRVEELLKAGETSGRRIIEDIVAGPLPAHGGSSRPRSP